MPLNIALYQNSGLVNPIYFKAMTAQHEMTRSPFQMGLPSTAAGAQNQVFTLDLGQSTEQFSCSGLCNSVGAYGGATETTDADGAVTKYGLEVAAKTWWAYGDESDDLPRMTIDGGTPYVGHIKSITFRQEGAMEDRWNFDLIFIIRYDLGYNPSQLNTYAWSNPDISTFNDVLIPSANSLWTNSYGHNQYGTNGGLIMGRTQPFYSTTITLSGASSDYTNAVWCYRLLMTWYPFTPSTTIADFNTNGIYIASWGTLDEWASATINGTTGYFIKVTQSNATPSDVKTVSVFVG
jgi:hypothetical protein